MGCTGIEIGDLRRKIVIERRVTTPDGMGGNTSTWSADPADGVWAALRNLTGTERWEAHRVMPGNLIRVYVRWRDDGNGNPYYTTEDRIIHQGRTYTIIAVFDVEFRREFIQIDMQEGKP
jgi:SPP1 family predicted phage head-tail adaptor